MIAKRLQRIWAVTLRYLRQSTRDIVSIADFVCWPLIDIIAWGMTSVWFEQSGGGVQHIVVTIVSALVLWQIVYQSNMDITSNLLEEFWSQNLVNLFGSPLTIGEWISAVMLLGFIKMFFIVLLGSAVAWLLYAFNIFAIGWALIPFALSLLLTGWWLGFLTSAFIIYGGMRFSWATWFIGALIAPVIGIYYPVNQLPAFMQLFAKILPPTYIFEGMRTVIFSGTFPIQDLTISICLNIIYLTISIASFRFMFEKSRLKGLARIE